MSPDYIRDERIAMRDASGKLHFYLSDHLGSARVVIDSTGTVKDKYRTWAFGAPRSQSVSLDQKYRYTGKPFDEGRVAHPLAVGFQTDPKCLS